MPDMIGYFKYIKDVVTGYLFTVDETALLSSKAPKASPVFTGDVTLSGKAINATLPAFSARVDSAQSNIAVGSDVTIVFAQEIFDLASNFASNTFTAPVAGKYQFNVSLRLTAIDSASAGYDLILITTNRSYYANFDPRVLASDPAWWTMTLSCLADMDLNETAYVVVNQASGTQQTDIQTDSYFSGFLVC